jgi:hypothetical protein
VADDVTVVSVLSACIDTSVFGGFSVDGVGSGSGMNISSSALVDSRLAVLSSVLLERTVWSLVLCRDWFSGKDNDG